ncbi:MAG: PmoA family protein [Planctomycetes bacterium]|nr:PmoA family protein [Planctomycetota bacterium]
MRSILALGLACLSLVPVSAGDAPRRKITVAAFDRGYIQTLVSVKLDVPAGEWALVPVAPGADAAAAIPCQVDRAGGETALCWIEPPLAKGESRTYALVRGGGRGPSPNAVAVTRKEKTIDVTIGGKPFTTYSTAADLAKPFFYPVYGPTGKNMVRNFPMKKVEGEVYDHPHHRGIWFTFGQVFVEGREKYIDFWAEGSNCGRTVMREVPLLEQGPAFGRFVTRDDWVDASGKKVCEDERDIRIWASGEGPVIDFAIAIRASEGPIRFGSTKEGMFGIRVATTMQLRGGKGTILNARGQKDDDTWGKQAEWCDYSGPVEGDVVGFTIFEHPSSFRYPTYWHVRNYGLFAANPFGLKDFIRGYQGDASHTIAEGESITFRYRILLHRGVGKAEVLSALDDQYAHPPAVKVVE